MESQLRSHYDSVGWLWERGLRYGGVIDAGCADGQFALFMAEMGPTRGAAVLNVDAQEDYRLSLEAVKAAIGGHYRICAVGDADGGTIELQRGAHAYWASIRPADDRYWDTLNRLHDMKPVRVPLRSIDSLVAETALPGPYLLKMDIQGAEAAALAGAARTLADTGAVALEMMIEDFSAIHGILVEHGFNLFDLVDLNYTQSGVLGWFYAVYLNARHRALRPTEYWDPVKNDEILAHQAQRRDSIRSAMEDCIKRLRAGQWRQLPD